MRPSALASLALLSLLSAAANADTIDTLRITSGQLHVGLAFDFDLEGSNFSWQGEGQTEYGFCRYFDYDVGNCGGGHVGIDRAVMDNSEAGWLESTLTLEGITYSSVDAHILVEPTPPVGFFVPDPPPAVLTITRPFQLNGSFTGYRLDNPDELQYFLLDGNGKATLTLQRRTVWTMEMGPQWDYTSSALLEFSEPVPEPGSMALFLTGIATVCVFRRCTRGRRFHSSG